MHILHRKSNWTKPVAATPASDTTYEKPRADSPAPTKYTEAEKKEYQESKKAEADKTEAKSRKRSASARKKAAKKELKGAHVAVTLETDGSPPLER